MQAIGAFLAGIINGIAHFATTIWQNLDLTQYSLFQIILDVLLVAVLFYWLIMIIRGTRATNIVLGFIVIVIVFAISRWFNLVALGWLLDRLLTVILVAIPIIFQQEIRRGLEKLGKTKFFLAQEAKEIDITISELIETCFEMGQKKIGALIVFKGEVSLKEYLDTGVALHAHVSRELLLSLFSKSSPLHDGAIIIEENEIVAAGCVLPHSFKEYGHRFGTRHKAALGLSESTDAQIFVVSEERGVVSYVNNGNIEESISPERMQQLLLSIMAPRRVHKSQRKAHNRTSR